MFKKSLDPRWILLTNHTLLLSTGVLFFNLNRTLPQIIYTLTAAVLTELVLAKIFDKELDQIGSRVLSAVIAGLGFLILTYSHTVWYYPCGAIIAVASKYIFRRNKRDHIFNPTGFAIIFAFAFFPGYQPIFKTDFFLTSIFPSLQVLTLGIIAVILARRWILPLTYFITLITGAFFLDRFGGQSFVNLVGPELSVVGILIPFFMITDPKSTPDNRWGLALIGVSYGLWNLIFKVEHVYAGNFIAIFINQSLTPLFRSAFERVNPTNAEAFNAMSIGLPPRLPASYDLKQ